MRNFIVVIFVALVLLVIAVWYYSGQNQHAEQARTQISGAASETGQFLKEKLGLTNLTAQDIKDEMAKTGRIVREKAGEVGTNISNVTADTRITTEIKAKYLKDADLRGISVNTTNGKVTLSGTASSPETIKRAMQLAMETDGVREVTSTLQVKS